MDPTVPPPARCLTGETHMQLLGLSAAGALVATFAAWTYLTWRIGRQRPPPLMALGQWPYWRAAFGQLWTNPLFARIFLCSWISLSLLGFALKL